MAHISDARAERLFARAVAIMDRRANGLAGPILWHLALRGYGWGMTELARTLQAEGPVADGWSAAGLNYRAWRFGNDTGAWNMAMDCFNRRDLIGYRSWLRRASNAGSEEAAHSLRKFETRLWHGAARDIGRHRPEMAHDGFWCEARLERRKAAMLRRRT